MRVQSLRIKNYRNYEGAQIDFADTFNIIYGNNAQGKTNIIEAVFLCASGRSHRTSKDSELLRYGNEYFDIRLKFQKNNVEEEINIKFSNSERKKICINDIPLRKIGGLMGHLNAIIFSPEDLLVIKQGPAERRRFIDITLSQLKPSYFYNLQQYSRILFQRNNLLKSISLKKELTETLDVWDQHLIKTGSKIIQERKKFVNRINTLAGYRHERLTNRKEKLELIYNSSFNTDHVNEENDIEQEFMRNIVKNRDREIQKGITMTGPQRDDIDIILNGESAKVFASQGQQRTSVLSVKLAEIDLMKEETGENPILLLDDVLSELDDKRKQYLLDNIEGMQTLITSTEKRFFTRSNEGTAFFYVENGKIITE